MNRLTITILATLAIFTASTAFAVVVPVLGGEDPDLQEVLDGITEVVDSISGGAEGAAKRAAIICADFISR